MAKQIAWGQLIIALLILPATVVVTALALAQSRLSQLFPVTWPWTPATTTALELSMVTLVVWAIYRREWPMWRWRDVGRVVVEAFTILGLALVPPYWFGQFTIAQHFHFVGAINALIFLGPLAAWCMAEEVVLRVVLRRILAPLPTWVRDSCLLVLACLVQWMMITPQSYLVIAVIVAGESVSLLSMALQPHFGIVWGRRWAWRWILIGLLGAQNVGFATALTSPFTPIVSEAATVTVVAASALASWCLIIGYTYIAHRLAHHNHHNAKTASDYPQ
ncbi:MAG: hypothetical protein EBS29_07195 [Chloroflexia bacterium]|nr:hypothetical protein [Chloroflexia bacterium]